MYCASAAPLFLRTAGSLCTHGRRPVPCLFRASGLRCSRYYKVDRHCVRRRALQKFRASSCAFASLAKSFDRRSDRRPSERLTVNRFRVSWLASRSSVRVTLGPRHWTPTLCGDGGCGCRTLRKILAGPGGIVPHTLGPRRHLLVVLPVTGRPCLCPG